MDANLTDTEDDSEEYFTEMPDGALPVMLQGKVFHDCYRGEAFVYNGYFYYRYVGDGTGVAGKSVFRKVTTAGRENPLLNLPAK